MAGSQVTERVITCTSHEYADAIRAIVNDVIANSTALYEYAPRTRDTVCTWLDAKLANHWPVIGVVSASGELLGFATYGPFRPWPAYKYTVEHSVYVRVDQRGRGIGSKLLRQLVTIAQSNEYHAMVAGIDADNAASIALHTRLGFSFCGTIRHAGFKFGRWLDLSFYQLLLESSLQPVDG